MSILVPYILDTMPDEEPASAGVFSAERPRTAPAFLSTALHGTLGYFSEGMPLAYLLATVITGLGLLIGSLVHVSGPEQVARNRCALPFSPLSR